MHIWNVLLRMIRPFSFVLLYGLAILGEDGSSLTQIGTEYGQGCNKVGAVDLELWAVGSLRQRQ